MARYVPFSTTGTSHSTPASSQMHTGPQAHTGLQRTGTMQFMAIARLESEAWGGYRVHEADGYRVREADVHHGREADGHHACEANGHHGREAGGHCVHGVAGHRAHEVAGHLHPLYRHDLEAFFYILAWMKNNARACLNSKRSFIHDQRWPHDSLPTDSWSSAMKVFANSIRFFFAVMLRKREGSAESQAGSAESQAGSAESQAGSPESWMKSQFDDFIAQIEGRALPPSGRALPPSGRALPPSGRALPPPKEDDKPTEIWEDFCGAVKEGLLTLSIDSRTNLKKEDLPPRLASFLPDSQMDVPL
ncbi:hypothetical protein EV122DRAFT_277712 [Schizophyllum commune]